ncbi:hypothetical protein LCGC14_2196880 [marine sediment metagenome]|uniref:Uncharacterized protein n=1 Tax=marine sediment metagenome TaxID=412755 RepID=A0A0F9FVC6_9ZZZZ
MRWLTLTMKDDSLNDLPGVAEWLEEVAILIEEESKV